MNDFSYSKKLKLKEKNRQIIQSFFKFILSSLRFVIKLELNKTKIREEFWEWFEKHSVVIFQVLTLKNRIVFSTILTKSYLLLKFFPLFDCLFRNIPYTYKSKRLIQKNDHYKNRWKMPTFFLFVFMYVYHVFTKAVVLWVTKGGGGHDWKVMVWTPSPVD